MKIRLDENGYIISFCTIGDLPDGIPYDGEIPENFAEVSGFYRLENGVLVFDADKQQEQLQSESDQQEMAEITEWFHWYDNQCMQYARTQRLGEPFDRDMQMLDLTAREKQLRLRELQNKA